MPSVILLTAIMKYSISNTVHFFMVPSQKRQDQHHTQTDSEASIQAQKSTSIMLLLVIGTETAIFVLDMPDIICSSDTCNSSFLQQLH